MYSQEYGFKRQVPTTSAYRYPTQPQQPPFQEPRPEFQDRYGYSTVSTQERAQAQFVFDEYSNSSYPVQPKEQPNQYNSYYTEVAPNHNSFVATQQQQQQVVSQVLPPQSDSTSAEEFLGVTRELEEMFHGLDSTETTHPKANSTRGVHHSSEERRSDRSLEAEVIAAATAVRTQEPVFAKPSPRSAPVKQMKTPFIGKRMSQDKKKYVSTEEEGRDTDDASDSENREEVLSPVPAMQSRSPSEDGREKNATKRTRDSSSSSNSSSSSPERITNKRLEEKRNGGHKKAKKSTREEKDKGSHTKKRRSRSRSRTKSVPKSTPTKESTKNNSRHDYRAYRSPSIDISQRPVTPNLLECTLSESPAGGARDSPAVFMQDNTNNLFKKILNDKASLTQKETDQDAVSRATSMGSKRSKRRKTPTQISLDLTMLIKYLTGDLAETDLARQTVRVINDLYRNTSQTKAGHIIDSIRSITYVPVDVSDQQLEQYPLVHCKNYLFCAYKQDFGHDYEAIERKRDLFPQSLLTALRPKCNQKKNSLDLMFRHSMKELCDEIHEFDESGDISLENPVFVSGRYLELRLLQLMRENCKKNTGHDMIKYLTDSCPDQESPIKPLVEESTCEMYVRKLLDRYDLRPANIDKILTEIPSTPQKMRVWTNAECQTASNIALANYIGSVYEEVTSEWSSLSEDEKSSRSFYREFTIEYGKRMKTFFRSHEKLLSNTLKASELMSWICFGVATNNSILGTATMAASYMMAKKNQNNPLVCWNYPLASIHRREPLVTTNQPVITLDEYFTGLEETIELEGFD